MRIEQALEKYVLQLRGNGRSDHTIAQVRRHVRLFEAWLDADGHTTELAHIDHETVALFLASAKVTKRADGRPRKPTSANALRSSLRCFFGFAHAAGYATANPARLVQRARCDHREPKALPDGDCERLVAALNRARSPSELRDRALFLTLLSAGLRIGSALHLDVADADLDAGELRLRRMKNGGEDVTYVPPATVAVLREYLGDRTNGPLFRASHGGRLTARSVHRRLVEWAERAGIAGRVHPHRLRHSFAMRVYERTQDVLVTSRALCHRSLASTAIYARPSKAAVRTAVEHGWLRWNLLFGNPRGFSGISSKSAADPIACGVV
jgi:integrase/recombinase XerC